MTMRFTDSGAHIVEHEAAQRRLLVSILDDIRELGKMAIADFPSSSSSRQEPIFSSLRFRFLVAQNDFGMQVIGSRVHRLVMLSELYVMLAPHMKTSDPARYAMLRISLLTSVRESRDMVSSHYLLEAVQQA